jgi:hypothetical protein
MKNEPKRVIAEAVHPVVKVSVDDLCYSGRHIARKFAPLLYINTSAAQSERVPGRKVCPAARPARILFAVSKAMGFPEIDGSESIR